MKPETKKRLIWSPVGGLVIPTVYFFIQYYLDKIFDLPDNWFLLPLIWPAYFYDLLFPRPAEPVTFEMPGPGFWIYLAVANFLFYSLLTYLFLRRKERLPRLR